jgi:hypothetical protein
MTSGGLWDVLIARVTSHRIIARIPNQAPTKLMICCSGTFFFCNTLRKRDYSRPNINNSIRAKPDNSRENVGGEAQQRAAMPHHAAR